MTMSAGGQGKFQIVPLPIHVLSGKLGGHGCWVFMGQDSAVVATHVAFFGMVSLR